MATKRVRGLNAMISDITNRASVDVEGTPSKRACACKAGGTIQKHLKRYAARGINNPRSPTEPPAPELELESLVPEPGPSTPEVQRPVRNRRTLNLSMRMMKLETHTSQ